jgi:hypothetical protein
MTTPSSHLAPLEQDIVIANYQSLIGSLLCLTYTTYPDLYIAASLPAQYNNQPYIGHYDTANYALRYIRGTPYHGITFSSKTNKNLVNLFGVNVTDKKSLYDAKWGPKNVSGTPTNARARKISTAYTRSLYGYGHITYHSGGSISWSVFREAQNIRSSFKAEIKSADEATRDTHYLHHIMNDLHFLDCNTPTPVIYNDNHGCLDGSKSTWIRDLVYLNI